MSGPSSLQPGAIAPEMATTLSAVEHRCLQLVMMAEAKAKEERATLEARIRELEAGEGARLDEVDAAVHECEQQLEQTTALLGSVSTDFTAAHDMSHNAIKRLVQQRATSETSAFQRVKLAIAEFHDYRREMKRNALWRIAQHQKATFGAPPSVGEGRTSPSIAAQAQSTPDRTGSMLVPAGGASSRDERVGAAQFRHRAVLDSLRERFVGIALSDDNEDVPFLLDAVYAYLVGAVESLLSFGETIAKQLAQAHNRDVQLRREFLLDEEREILKRRVRQENPPSAVSEISNEAMARVLLEKLVHQQEDRASACQNILRQSQDELTALAREHLGAISTHSANQLAAVARAALLGNATGLSGGTTSSGRQSPNRTLAPATDSASQATRHVALMQYKQNAEELGPRLYTQLVEQHNEDCLALRAEFESRIDELRRVASQREVVINQDVTVFSLEQLQAEREHRLLTSRVMFERFETIDSKYKGQIIALTESVTQLQLQLEEARMEKAAALKRAEEKDSQIAQLEETNSVRAQSSIALKAEVRELRYEVNYASFGETWQESLLNMRARIHKELRDENMRFVAKVSNIIRTHIGDESQTEQLYEARLQSVVREMEADHQRRIAEMKRRFAAERQLLQDECELRIKAAKEDARAEREAHASRLEEEYNRKVGELNNLFDEKVRAWEGRVADKESFFDEKLIELRKYLAERENELQMASARRDIEVVQQYEAEAEALKRALNEREHAIEADRMKIMASVENKIHEKVMTIRRSFDVLLKQLQETVFAFAEQQRAAFDEQRAKEHMIFSHFMFGSIRAHQEHGQLEIESANRRVEVEALDAQKRQAEALGQLQKRHNVQLQHSEDMFTVRIVTLRDEQEKVLRRTQDLRCEQDMQFWNRCADQLRDAQDQLVRSKAEAEAIMQQRYVDIIVRVNQYLQNDVTAAHQTFERECRIRQKQLQGWVNQFHKISIHAEALLWLEVCGRATMEKEYFSILSSMRIMEGEERRTKVYCGQLDDQPYEDIEQLTFDEIVHVRKGYEVLLEKHRDFSANISHDYMTAIAASLREQQQTSTIMSGIFTTRLEALTQGLKDRFAVYSECRDNAINKELQRIVDLVQQTAIDFMRDEAARMRPTVAFSDADDLDDDDPAGAAMLSSAGRGRRLQRGGRSPASGRRARSANATPVPFGNTPSPLRDLGNSPSGRKTPARRGGKGVAGAENVSPGRAYGIELSSADLRLVEYFASLRGIMSKAFDDLDSRIDRQIALQDEQRNTAVRQIHDSYLDATASTMRRLEEQQNMIDERDSAIVQLAGRLDAKAAAEARAAILAEDLGVLAHKYDMLSRGWMLHAAVDAPRKDKSAAASGGPATDTGSPGASTSPHSRDAGRGDEARVMLAFVTGLGGKRPTRDAVLENVAMRERIVATEWFGDDLMREAMSTAAVGALDSPPRPRRRRGPRNRRRGDGDESYVDELPDDG